MPHPPDACGLTQFQIGDSFWVQTRSEPIEHIWVLITKPNPLNKTSIWVNVTTARSWSDRTTVLRIGDHPTVDREAVVYYRGAKRVDLVKLEYDLQSGQARRTSRCPDTLLARIQTGILASRLTPKETQGWFNAEKAAGRASLTHSTP